MVYLGRLDGNTRDRVCHISFEGLWGRRSRGVVWGAADPGAALLLPGHLARVSPTVTMHAVNRPFCASPATRPVLGSPVLHTPPSWQCTFDIGERPRDPQPSPTPLAAQSGSQARRACVCCLRAVCRLKDDASREQLHQYGIFRGQIAPGRCFDVLSCPVLSCYK